MDAPTEEDCCHSDCKNCVLDIYLRQSNSKSQKPPNYVNQILSQTRYKAFRLVRMEATTPNAKVYTFDPENSEGKAPFFFKAGDHLVLRNNPETSKLEHLSRPYTLIPWDLEYFTFSVVIKLYPRGKMSEFISRWRLGDITYWRGPYGDFTYQPNTFTHVVMLCIGTGMAPMYALAKHITEDENDETFIQLHYGSPTPQEIILRKEISLLAGFWNFKCTHYVSQGYHKDEEKFNENFVTGRIQKEHVEAVLEQLDISKLLVLVCGTEEFNVNMSEVLNENGLSGKHVHIFR